MKIKVLLHFDSQDHATLPSQSATITNKVIYLWEGLNKHINFPFTPDFDVRLKEKFRNSKFNVRIPLFISGAKIEYYVKLNPIDLFRLKWMFRETYIQKEHKWILGYVFGFICGYLLWIVTHR
jgi:hypothetical protein